jgi:hypothetical protein
MPRRRQALPRSGPGRRSRGRHFNIANEAIPSPSDCLNEDWSLCGFAERIAQPLDGSIQAVIEIDESVLRSEFAAQFLSAHHFSRSFKQRRQDLQWLFLELYLLPPLAQFAGVKIDLECTETDNSG